MDNEIHQSIWHACSGVFAMKPLMSSTVYYFPQGHVENYGGSEAVRALCADIPKTKCHVTSMTYMADAATDEVFAHMSLQPMLTEDTNAVISRSREPVTVGISGMCLKNLDISDINERCSFHDDQYCNIDSLFEKEDMMVSIYDLHNQEWRFGHVYDTASSSHYLVAGWSSFVSCKNLHAGDELVFLKRSDGIVTVGIRRTVNMTNDAGFFYKIRNEEGVADQVGRTGKNLCSVEALGKAIGNALKKDGFEAVFYPTVGKSSFFYDSNEVDSSTSISWVTGMRVIKNAIVEYKGVARRISKFGLITYVHEDGHSWKNVKVLWEWEDAYAEEEENCWEITPSIPTAPKDSTQKRKTEEFMLFGQKISVQQDSVKRCKY